MAERSVYWIGKIDAGLRSAAEKHGVRATAKKIHRHLLVTGTGRCGTTWLSRTLLATGLDVPHEHMGKHGTVSMYFQVDSPWYPFIPWAKPLEKIAHVGERRSDFNFNHVVHLVRHPLKVAASMRSIIGELTYEWAEFNNLLPVPWNYKPVIVRNLLYWLASTENCERQADQTIVLDNFSSMDWDEMLRHAGLPRVEMPEIPPANKSSGFKKHEPPTWRQVAEWGEAYGRPSLYDELWDRCAIMGIKP